MLLPCLYTFAQTAASSLYPFIYFNHGCQIVQAVLLPCLYTFAHLTMVVRLLKPCVIVMFVYLRPFNHGCQIVQAVCYCHVCIPSHRQQHHSYILLYILTMVVRLFKSCVIVMFVYLRPFNHGCQIVKDVCYCHVCIPSHRQQHHNYILLYMLTMVVR